MTDDADISIDARGELTLRVVESLSDIDAALWDVLAADDPARSLNPFVRHAFLKCLEDSHCTGRAAGWLPQHLVLSDENDQIIAVAPAYLKSHSQGEYVFDHGWADAFERAGGRYYPKLQLSVPFTPATGPRLLVGSGAEADWRRHALAQAIKGYVEASGASSAHATFLTERDRAALSDDAFLQRTDQQFHFVNRGYESYDAFLETLASRKRKALRKERRDALSNGITIERLTGSSLSEAAWDAFFSFYQDTGARKWGRPYLNRAFFSLLGERMGELSTQLVEHALGSFAQASGTTLHLSGSGRNDHHLAEAAFKALARSLRAAVAIDPRRSGVASTKGSLERSGR